MTEEKIVKLQYQPFIHEIKCDFYIFFNKNNDENENYIAYYSDYKLYICKINFKDLIYENKIDKNKCEEIDLKEYINDKLLNIKYYYKNPKNILICKSNENILLIDIDNKDNINSIYKKEDKVNIISTILVNDSNFKVFLYNKNNFTFSIYNINDKLEFLKDKEKNIESLKDLSISFLEYYNNNIILIGKKIKDNKDYNFIYLIDDNLNNINLDDSNNIKYNKEKETKKILINNDSLIELSLEGKDFYYYNLKNIFEHNKFIKNNQYYEFTEFLDFLLFNNQYIITYNNSKIFLFDIKTNNISFVNTGIGRRIKSSYVLKYKNNEYLTTLYDDYDNYNKILLWKRDKLKNNLNDILTIANKVLDGKYGNEIYRKTKLIKEGYDYTEVQSMVNFILQNKFINNNKEKNK